MFRAPLLSVVLILLSFAQAAQALDPSPAEAAEALEAATRYFRTVLSCKGGYLGEYDENLTTWIGEVAADPGQIWVQPPGTPEIGLTFVRAYELTGDARCLEAATAVADSLIWGQLVPGGWTYIVDFLRENSYKYRHEPEGDEMGSESCFFDDDVSQGATRLLMAVDGLLGRDPYHEATLYALNFMMESQFPDGAWPQWYPLSGNYPRDYPDYYTFNDNAINDCIDVMMEAYLRYGDPRYLASAERGGHFIIISQIEHPQAGWAQQYYWNLTPAPARPFEPAAVCSRVTSGNIRTLLELYLFTGNDTYLDPIPAAVEWLESSTIRENRWARFYQLGTNLPIYGDRDGRIYYNLSDISEERRLGYGWEGGYGLSGIRMYENVVSVGREEYLANRNRELSPEERAQRAASLEGSIRGIIEDLDDQGRWVEDGWIYSRTFNRNAGLLLDYLEYADYRESSVPPTLGEYAVRVNGTVLTLSVQASGVLPLAGVELRFSPPTSTRVYVLTDDGRGGDLVGGDGVYSVSFDLDPDVSTKIHEGVVVAVDADGHWNLSVLPLGIISSSGLGLLEVSSLVAEGEDIGANVTWVRLQAEEALADLGRGSPDELASLIEELLHEAEAAVVWRLIEMAGEVIEEAKALGVDTSRHEIFLHGAKEHFANGAFGSARQLTNYPLRLREEIPQALLGGVALGALVALGGAIRSKRLSPSRPKLAGVDSCEL